MVKPRNRPRSVNTAHFSGVTPLWVQPGQAPVSECYHAASMSLADWAGPAWSDNDASGYFPLRHFLVGICERWRSYDWQADADLIATRKRAAKNREALARATRAFRHALGQSAFRTAERDLGVSIVHALSQNPRTAMKYEEGCDAVSTALRALEDDALRPDRAPVRYGPLTYCMMPQRLPEREIAVALVLADLVTGFRKDEHRGGGVQFPRQPQLSPNLPWKAIAEFATANSDDGEAKTHPDNVATRVRNLRRKVAQIRRYP